MTEVLFILTTIFVAYVVYVIVNEQKSTTKQVPSEIKPETQAVVEQPKPQISIPKVQPVATKKTAPTVMPNTAKGSVREPKTGEIASVSSNYRFTKRWVKEALVAEGLLEKIYKNNELDTDTEAKIKDALVKLETMDKYRA